MPCSTLLELLLPVLFILGLVAASRASPATMVSGEEFVDPATGSASLGTYAPSPVFDINDWILSSVCYSGNDQDLRAVLQPCNTNTTVGFSPAPAKYATGRIPDGMQFNLLTSPPLLIGLLSDFQAVWRTISFDHMVVLQWLVRAAFGPNSKVFASGIQAMLQNSGAVLITPESAEATDMVAYFNRTFATWKYVFGGYRADWQSTVDELVTVAGEGTTWAILQIDAVTATELQVQISMNLTNTPTTLSVLQRFSGGLGGSPYPFQTYFVGGFVVLQNIIQSYYVTERLGLSPLDVAPYFSNVDVAPMPFATYRNSVFLQIAGNVSPLVLVLAFLYSVSQLAKRIVEEKESRLREAMMIMGLGKGAFFLSWLFNYTIQVILSTAVITAVLKAGILTQTDPSVVFCLYFAFGLSTIALSTLLSSFFSKSRLTALVVPLLYFVISIPSFALPDGTSRGTYVLLSIFSPTAFSLGTKLLFSYEINTGMGWNDVGSSLDQVFLKISTHDEDEMARGSD